MLGREHLAGAAEAVDDFVEDQQHAVPVADLAHPLPVSGRGDMVRIRGRNRLAYHRRHRVGALRLDFLRDCLGAGEIARFALEFEIVTVAVRRRHEADTVHERPEKALVARGGDAHGTKGRAVIAAAPDDDLVALGKAAHRLHLLGDLHGALDRLGTAGAEKEPVEIAGCQPRQHVAQLHGGEVGVARRGDIGEFARLLRHRLGDLGAAMPDIDDIKPGEPVEIGAALRVVEPAALAAHHDPEPVAFGKIEPARAVYPHMLERLLLDRRKLMRAPRIVSHRKPPTQPRRTIAQSGVRRCLADRRHILDPELAAPT